MARIRSSLKVARTNRAAAYRSQRLTVNTSLPVFLVVGALFAGVGFTVLYLFRNSEEVVVDYTYCTSVTNSSQLCTDIVGHQSDGQQRKCWCEVPFRIKNDMTEPVFLYYGLIALLKGPRRQPGAAAKVEEPKVEELQVEKSKVEKPKEEELQVEKSKVEELQVEKPKVEELQVEKPKVEELLVVKSKVEELQVENSKVKKPKEEELQVEKSEVEELQVEKPKVKELQVEKPKVEELQVEKPKVEELQVEKPEVKELHVEKRKVEELQVKKPKDAELQVEKPKVEELPVEKPKVEELIGAAGNASAQPSPTAEVLPQVDDQIQADASGPTPGADNPNSFSVLTDSLTVFSVDRSMYVRLNQTGAAWPDMRCGKCSRHFAMPVRTTSWNSSKAGEPQRVAGGELLSHRFENDDFMVWMQPIARSTFEKLYGKANYSATFNGTLPRGKYRLLVAYTYPVTVYGGGKSLIVANSTVLGAKNRLLGLAFVATGCVCLIMSMILCGMRLRKRVTVPKKTV